MNKTLINGDEWLDSNGHIIHAHGGHILYKDGYYYWYGENRLDNNYVSCYRSKDLMNWEFRNNILTTESKTEQIRVRTKLNLLNETGKKVNLERPKVIYNVNTKKYVLWVHYENGEDYCDAAAAIATCDTPDGDFTYHGSFNPYGYMSRDCTLFKDDDGTAYFISASRNNADLHIYRLADDYMNVDCLVNKLWQGEYREAPAVVKKDNTYYMLSSFCTGWDPNQGKYSSSASMSGKWRLLENIGDETTFDTQPAFILTIFGEKENEYVYVADRWDGDNYHNSRYVFLKLIFEDDKKISMKYCDEFKIDLKNSKFIEI
ncbi:MAG: family 43 glycosylhydrolase [Clostridium sp.]|nr:family 43 glycosylhydrolase [Clostridium sp.]